MEFAEMAKPTSLIREKALSKLIAISKPLINLCETEKNGLMICAFEDKEIKKGLQEK